MPFVNPPKCHYQHLLTPKRHQKEASETPQIANFKGHKASYRPVTFIPEYFLLDNTHPPGTVLFSKVLKHEGTFCRKFQSDRCSRDKLRYAQNKWKGWEINVFQVYFYNLVLLLSYHSSWTSLLRLLMFFVFSWWKKKLISGPEKK